MMLDHHPAPALRLKPRNAVWGKVLKCGGYGRIVSISPALCRFLFDAFQVRMTQKKGA